MMRSARASPVPVPAPATLRYGRHQHGHCYCLICKTILPRVWRLATPRQRFASLLQRQCCLHLRAQFAVVDQP
jgi:hypothetical protein